ncbi:MAG TPA: hypothetical protein VMF13_10015 [Luteitalea sp.]|nr:hypothetical protein [Luteitalea sp.]
MPARPPITDRPAFVPVLAILTALALGGLATWYYAGQDLTLSHYDAKAHLVVARRIFDSLTPGWRQIGAVWLPLPHVLNALPVQVDAWYRTGASGVAISMISFAAAAASLAWLVARLSGSVPAAVATLAVFVYQPDLLYLQATPMTEPLLLGLTIGGIALLTDWTLKGGVGPAWPAGLTLALACLTRYESWPMTVGAGLVAWLTLWRTGGGFLPSAMRALRVGLWPAGALVLFLILSKATVGEWLVTGGFYEPNNPAYREPAKALVQVGWGLGRVGGWPVAWAGAAGAVVVLLNGLVYPQRQAWWFTLALSGSAALPYYAFVSGHPFRIRYMILLIAAAAACIGMLVSLVPKAFRIPVVALVLAVLAYDRVPLGLTSPMVAEAQWDRANQAERRTVTACLVERWKGEPILVSMGSLAHYMQETSRDGFGIHDYIHEGIGEIWFEALKSPRRHAAFLLIEERAEGGDQLFRLAKEDPTFLDGFTRTCEGGGVALYTRTASLN